MTYFRFDLLTDPFNISWFSAEMILGHLQLQDLLEAELQWLDDLATRRRLQEMPNTPPDMPSTPPELRPRSGSHGEQGQPSEMPTTPSGQQAAPRSPHSPSTGIESASQQRKASRHRVAEEGKGDSGVEMAGPSSPHNYERVHDKGQGRGNDFTGPKHGPPISPIPRKRVDKLNIPGESPIFGDSKKPSRLLDVSSLSVLLDESTAPSTLDESSIMCTSTPLRPRASVWRGATPLGPIRGGDRQSTGKVCTDTGSVRNKEVGFQFGAFRLRDEVAQQEPVVSKHFSAFSKKGTTEMHTNDGAPAKENAQKLESKQAGPETLTTFEANREKNKPETGDIDGDNEMNNRMNTTRTSGNSKESHETSAFISQTQKRKFKFSKLSGSQHTSTAGNGPCLQRESTSPNVTNPMNRDKATDKDDAPTLSSAISANRSNVSQKTMNKLKGFAFVDKSLSEDLDLIEPFPSESARISNCANNQINNKGQDSNDSPTRNGNQLRPIQTRREGTSPKNNTNTVQAESVLRGQTNNASTKTISPSGVGFSKLLSYCKNGAEVSKTNNSQLPQNLVLNDCENSKPTQGTVKSNIATCRVTNTSTKRSAVVSMFSTEDDLSDIDLDLDWNPSKKHKS